MNLNKYRSNNNWLVLLLLTIFGGFIGLDSFYIKKWFTGLIRFVLFASLITIILYWYTVLKAVDPKDIFDRAINFAKDELEKMNNDPRMVDSSYRLKALMQIILNTFDKFSNIALQIISVIVGIIIIAIVIIFYWFILIITTLLGQRRDNKGLKIKMFGTRLE